MDEAGARLLVIAAHPDDAEIFAGGLMVRHARAGSSIRIISVTDGRSGHHKIPPEKLVGIRRREAAAAGDFLGAEYVTWDFQDGSLFPNLKVREAIIRAIRDFGPDLILTHRTCDYHPDHRAVGVAVQDASYMVTVPSICSDSPALSRDPVVAYMCDQFTRPNRMRVDVLIDVTAELSTIVEMASKHKSQFFEWLPYHDGCLDAVPSSDLDRITWLNGWFGKMMTSRFSFFQREVQARKIDPSKSQAIEAYEISEYARQPEASEAEKLFLQ